jgi:hypothetical protein
MKQTIQSLIVLGFVACSLVSGAVVKGRMGEAKTLAQAQSTGSGAGLG